MALSARNAFEGRITRLQQGAVNSEIDLTLSGGEQIVAIVTTASVAELGLAEGLAVFAYVKAPWVMLLAGPAVTQFSARNQLTGRVSAIDKGAINSAVSLQLASGTMVEAVVTNEAVLELGLREGVIATALIKASHVILAVPG